MRIVRTKYLTLLLLTSAAHAEVVLENDLSLVSVNNEYNITEDLGRVQGSNLFHNFNQFNIDAGETATFSGSGNIKNVISRVSGDGPSNINGTLTSEISGANLWLLNPNGVLFGETASLNISGSFHVSTADYLNFDNGSRLSISESVDNDIYSNTEPKSLGFSTDSPGSIIINRSDLSITENNDINIVAGNINIHNSNLTVNNGNINIVGIADAVDLSSTNDVLEFNLADVNISDSNISALGENNQGISIIGGKLVISDSDFSERSTSAQENSTISITGKNTVMSNTNLESFQSTNIVINSDHLIIRDVTNLEDTGVIDASLNVNNLRISDSNLSDINITALTETLDSDTNIVIQTDSIVASDSQQGSQLASIDIDNASQTDVNTGSSNNSNDSQLSGTAIPTATPTNQALEFSVAELSNTNNSSAENKNDCGNRENSIFNSRPIIFQAMPGEFNPGAMYQKVDLANLASSNSALGLFKQCG